MQIRRKSKPLTLARAELYDQARSATGRTADAAVDMPTLVALLLLLLAHSAVAQPPRRPGPPERRPGPRGPVSIDSTRSLAGSPDSAPERPPRAEPAVRARPLGMQCGRYSERAAAEYPWCARKQAAERRAPAPPRYDPIFNPIIAISTNQSTAAATTGSIAGTTGTSGVQTVSANTAQSLQAPVSNVYGDGMATPCAPSSARQPAVQKSILRAPHCHAMAQSHTQRSNPAMTGTQVCLARRAASLRDLSTPGAARSGLLLALADLHARVPCYAGRRAAAGRRLP